jgi:hypothetical protein
MIYVSQIADGYYKFTNVLDNRYEEIRKLTKGYINNLGKFVKTYAINRRQYD